MAITFGNVGATAFGTTSCAPGIPATTAAGDMLILFTSDKYPPAAPDTPAGWNFIGSATGGAGATGIDSGGVVCAAYFRIADGTEGATVTVSCVGGNVTYGKIARYTKAANEQWLVSGPSVGSFALGTVSWATTGDAMLDMLAGDRIIAVSSINSDTYTYSAQSVAVAGVVIGTQAERQDGGTSTGDDVGIVMSDHVVTSGVPASAPAFTMTASGASAGVSPAGATVMFRLRAIAPSYTTAAITTGIGIGL